MRILESLLNDSKYQDLRERYMLIEEMANSLHRQKVKKYGKLFRYNQKRYGANDVFINSVCVDDQGNTKYTRGIEYTLEQLIEILMGDIIIEEQWATMEKQDQAMQQATILRATPTEELEGGKVHCCELDDCNVVPSCEQDVTVCHSEKLIPVSRPVFYDRPVPTPVYRKKFIPYEVIQ